MEVERSAQLGKWECGREEGAADARQWKMCTRSIKKKEKKKSPRVEFPKLTGVLTADRSTRPKHVVMSAGKNTKRTSQKGFMACRDL